MIYTNKTFLLIVIVKLFKMECNSIECYPISEINTVSKIKHLLTGLLSPCAQERSKFESLYNELKSNHTEFLLLALTEFLPQIHDYSLKTLACILLRQIFSNYSSDLLNLISSKSQQQLIESLLAYSQQEKNLHILRNFSEVLICFAALFHCNPIQTSKFINFCLSSCKENSISTFLGFYFLPYFFSNYHSNFRNSKEILFKIFENHFSNANNDIKIACCHAFCLLILTIDMPDAMYFGQLLPKLLKALLILPSNDGLFSSIRDAAEAEPFYFNKKMKLCLEFSRVVLKSDKTIECKFLCCEFLVEVCKNTLMIDKFYVGKAIELIREFMLDLSFDLPDSIEINYLNLTAGLIENIITTHLDLANEFIQDVCEKIKIKDIKWYIVGLIQLEHIIKFIGTKVSVIVSVFEQVDNEYARYLIVRCIGNIWKYSPLQEINIEDLIRLNLNSLNAYSEQLQSQALLSLTYFIERASKSAVQQLSETIAACLFESINHRNLKNYLKLLHSLIKRIKKSINPETIAPKLLQLLTCEFSLEVLQCLTELEKAFPIGIYLKEIVNILGLQNKVLDHHSLACWELLFKHASGDCAIYLPQLIPCLLKHIDKNYNSPLEHIEHYVQSLMCIVSYSGEHVSKYIEQCHSININFFQTNIDELQTIAAHFAVVIVKSTRVCKSKGSTELARIYIKNIWKLFENYTDIEYKLEFLHALKSLIVAFPYPFLTNEEAYFLSNSLGKVMKQDFGFEIFEEECKIAAHLISRHPEIACELNKTAQEKLVEFLRFLNDDNEIYCILNIMCYVVHIAGRFMGNELLEYLEVFLKYSEFKDEKIRDKAIQGLGFFGTVISQQSFEFFSSRVMKTLEDAIANTTKYNYKYYQKAKNSAILTVGIILKNHTNCFKLSSMIDWWIRYLPINGDREKERKCESLLYEIIQENSEVMGCLSGKDITQIKNAFKEGFTIETSTSLDLPI